MTKLVLAVWANPETDLASRLLEVVGPKLTEVADGVQVNVNDSAVEGALLRITHFERPVDAVVSLWLDEVDAAKVVRTVTDDAAVSEVAGWWVEEVVPLPPPLGELGHRSPGLANIAFLRRPEGMDHPHWRERWKTHHTPVAIATQSTFGYIQNEVLGRATPDAPVVAAIVEELFPIQALGDLHAFYGSDGDEAELGRRMAALLESVATFGADRDLDVVPTSRYVLKLP